VASRARTGGSTRPPVGFSALSVDFPARPTPAGETVVLLGALLTGDWTVVASSEQRHRKEATGLVSAYVHWHLERSLRSMAYVER
jgi:DNA repair protein RecO (recombination protein O)